jgi:molybdate transport system substrate-binding protein
VWPILILGLLSGTLAPAEPGGPLLVSAAISLTEALGECGTAFSAATGIPVRFNFGPSNALARQIAEGAPVDVFVSADDLQMQLAVKSGAIAADAVRIVATNRLAIIVPGKAAEPWSSAAPLRTAAVRRVATGDPRAVPAGVYAKSWLQRTGLWEAVQPKIVPTTSVRGALAAVRSGAVDAGIVYSTDARAASEVAVVLEIAGTGAPSIEYPAGVVTRSRRAVQGRAFLKFLTSPVAQRIFQRHGFGPAAAAARK